MRSATPWLIRGLSVHHPPNKFAPGGFQSGARDVHRCFTQWMTKIGPIGCLWWHFLYVWALRHVRAPHKFRSTLLCSVVLLVFVFFAQFVAASIRCAQCCLIFQESNHNLPHGRTCLLGQLPPVDGHFCTNMHKHYIILFFQHPIRLFFLFRFGHRFLSKKFSRLWLLWPVTRLAGPAERAAAVVSRSLSKRSQSMALLFAENWKSVDCKETMKFQKIWNFPLKIFEKCNSKRFVSGVYLLGFHFVPLTCVINFEFRALRC